jgi:hypothetical protein
MSEQMFGAELTSLDEQAAGCLAGWLLGEMAEPPLSGLQPQWAVLQCVLSLVWAAFEEGTWHLASSYDPAVQKPTRENLREARVFGEEGEVLLWRIHSGFRGRVLRDGPVIGEDALRWPLCRKALFQPYKCHPKEEDAFGNTNPNTEKMVKPIDGTPFVTRTLSNGRVTVTPTGEYVRLKEYLSEDGGILRIAVTRFVEVV